MLVVGGTFDQTGGKKSSIIEKMVGCLGCYGLNGGTLEHLNAIVEATQKHKDEIAHDTLVWMPNIDNNEDKILPRLKGINRKMILVSSKRCVENEYKESDVVGHMLKNHCNLGIMIEKPDRYNFKLLDPLGNIYCDTSNIEQLCAALRHRVAFLKQTKRVPSIKIGPKREFQIEDEFVRIIKDYGERFATFINAINPNRFLGNAATRCTYGFPAVRGDGSFFVTRRNVEKRTLSSDDFVEIKELDDRRPESVAYYGNIKPSVDTPIQSVLFKHYAKVNYIIHGHVYVNGAKMTEHKHPCGSLNEVDEILELHNDPQATDFAVNLRGHGCLLMAGDLKSLEDQAANLIGRPFPEGE